MTSKSACKEFCTFTVIIVNHSLDSGILLLIKETKTNSMMEVDPSKIYWMTLDLVVLVPEMNIKIWELSSVSISIIKLSVKQKHELVAEKYFLSSAPQWQLEWWQKLSCLGSWYGHILYCEKIFFLLIYLYVLENS